MELLSAAVVKKKSRSIMKIIGLESVHVAEHGNLVWVQLHTDDGLVGLGETFRNPEATIAYLHETAAPALIGRDPRNREALNVHLRDRVGNHFSGFPTRSIEVRGNSAVDMALWDLCGQALEAPLHMLLGGLTRERIRIYNTCAGAGYNSKVRHGYNTALVSRDMEPPAEIGVREDLLLQVFDPARLAHELLDAGVTGMKIWPFDVAALRNEGREISAAELREALWPIEEIRKAVGDRMDIMIEYHGLWQLPAQLKIAAALAEHDIYWHEEPIGMHNFDDLAEYRRAVKGRVAAGENMGTVPWYREAFARKAVDVAHFDIAWIGGLSEGLRVQHLAEAHDRPIAPHDCTGPVTLACNVHMLAAAPNGLIAETVRAYLDGFYRDILTELPPVENGHISPLTKPGLGAALDPALFKRDDVTLRLSGERCR